MGSIEEQGLHASARHGAGGATPWLLCPPPAARRLRLYCFPYSGGNAVSFIPWQREIHPDIEVCAVQLPGRGARMREPALTSFATLIEQLTQVISRQDVLPFAFFGHSLGALIAFELTRQLRRQGLALPHRLIVSGCNAPPLRKPASRCLHELPDDELIERLRDYNGTPAEVLEHRELMRLLLPTIRADFALGADYHHTDEAPLALPLTACGGRDDPHVDAAGLQAWQHQSAGEFRLRWFEGDHFYINPQRQALLECLAEELLAPQNC